jgi:hypothetical protein
MAAPLASIIKTAQLHLYPINQTPIKTELFSLEQFKQYEIPREHHLAAVSYIYSIDNGTLTEDEISSHKQSRPSER